MTTVTIAQDTIVTLSNETLSVKILEVDYSSELVKFKKAELPDGPVYTEYLKNLFLINVENTPPIYFDPYENPYPGYQAIVPISMKRLERYSPSEYSFVKNYSRSQLEKLKGLNEDILVATESREKFEGIFHRVLRSTKEYCESRKFSIGEELDWQYVYVDCIENVIGICEIHSKFHHGFLDNAYSVGNGNFFFSEYFFNGLSEDVIAGIVAHEFGHALARHTLEHKRKLDDQQKITDWTAFAATVAHGGSYARNRRKIEFIGDAFFMMPYEREQEVEADKIGIVLMTLAGFEPSEIVKYWRTGERANHTGFLDDHPGGIERANNIESFINSLEFQILTKKR